MPATLNLSHSQTQSCLGACCTDLWNAPAVMAPPMRPPVFFMSATGLLSWSK